MILSRKRKPVAREVTEEQLRAMATAIGAEPEYPRSLRSPIATLRYEGRVYFARLSKAGSR